MKSTSPSPHTAHGEVWMLLPWYVNGTLKGEELDLVQHHLRICILCRRELALQQRTSKAIRNASIMDLSPQLSFSRLMRRIDREARQGRKGWWSSLRAQWAHLSYRLSTLLSLRRMLLGLSLLLLFIGLAPVAKLWLASVSKEPQYHTLADPNSESSAGKHDIRVIFAKTMEQEQIKQLLISLHAQIVDGPSSGGSYTVRIASGEHSDREVLTALDRLRHHPSVLFAEPAQPVATPKGGTGSVE
jgi:hypothetical protein